MGDIRDFRQVTTHGNVGTMARDLCEEYGAELVGHRYNAEEPRGTLQIRRAMGSSALPYGLPDDRDELKRLIVAACNEPVSQWKGKHRREW